MASTALATPPAIRSWSTRAISQKAIRKLFPDNRAADAFEAHFMSRKLGNELPATLLSLLDGNDLPARMGKAILITTVDAQGWAHPALLSYGEVVAIDARRLRLATYGGSRTSSNLRRSGRLTMCVIEAGMAYYVKTRALEQQASPKLPGLARFEATVEHVLEDQAREDLEPDARITRGIEFNDRRPASEMLADWAAVLKALRE